MFIIWTYQNNDPAIFNKSTTQSEELFLSNTEISSCNIVLETRQWQQKNY